jgi:hypothetical protein
MQKVQNHIKLAKMKKMQLKLKKDEKSNLLSVRQANKLGTLLQSRQ